MRKNKKILLTITAMLVLVSLLFSACGQTMPPEPEPAEDEEMIVIDDETGLPEESVEPSATPTPDLPDGQDSAALFNSDTITFKFYDVESDGTKEVTVKVPAGATLSFPLSVVAEQMLGQQLESSVLKPNSVIQQDGDIYIDFTDKILSINAGSSTESALLEAVSSIYLDNVAGAQKIFISVDDEDYSSGHLEFSKDKPYKMKSDGTDTAADGDAVTVESPSEAPSTDAAEPAPAAAEEDTTDSAPTEEAQFDTAEEAPASTEETPVPSPAEETDA